MRLLSLATLAIALLFIPQAALAGHELENGFPVELVNAAKEARPQGLDIAWSGSVYGIVYDDYWWNKKKTGCYFMVVDADGKVVRGPVRLSKKQHGLDPKITWAGNAFAVLHPAGKQLAKYKWDLKYYLTRFNEKGKKLSERTLVVIPGNELYADYGHLVWNGKELGIFLLADHEDKNLYTVLTFCSVNAKGVPGESKVISVKYDQASDVIWDGNRYVFLGMHRYTYDGSEQVPTARIILIDSDGEVITTRYFEGIALADEFRGASIVATHKKNVYLIAFSTLRPGSQTSPPTHWYDVYTTQVRIVGSKFSRFNPKNASQKMSDHWSFPTLVRDGRNYYLTANLGLAGCDFAFAKVNLKGKITSKPVQHSAPRPACGAAPPYPVMAGNFCGIIFVESTLMMHKIKP